MRSLTFAIGLTVVLTPGLVLATTNPGGFDFGYGLTEPVGIMPGTSTTIIISSVGSGVVQGVEVYLRLDEPFRIEALILDGPGSGTVFEFNTNGARPWIYRDPFAPASYCDYAGSDLTTNRDGVLVTPGSVVAKLVVSVSANAVSGTTGNLISRDLSDNFTIACNWADGRAVPQDQLSLVVAPEPAMGLLLICGLSILRRQRR